MAEPRLRPLGYVESDPVVRRIGDRDLYLGNLLAADADAHDRTFSYVLSATADEQPLTTHHRPLDDGPDNEWAVFEDAVDTARTLYRRDGSVLVHCKSGISRSTTLLATTLAAEDDLSFGDALATVQRARPSAMPHPALHEQAIVYLAAEK
ncbi:dual specificity protein phosphatase family protein [Halobacteriaceae archaeon GCM10025711]